MNQKKISASHVQLKRVLNEGSRVAEEVGRLQIAKTESQMRGDSSQLTKKT